MNRRELRKELEAIEKNSNPTTTTTAGEIVKIWHAVRYNTMAIRLIEKDVQWIKWLIGFFIASFITAAVML